MRRFRLRTIFVIVLVAAVGSLIFNEALRTRPPIQKPYSVGELQRNLQAGKPVLVTIDAHWALSESKRPRFMSTKVSKHIREKNLVSLTADWTKENPTVDALMTSINQTTVPTLVLYSPKNPNSPAVLSQPATDEQIIRAIDAALTE